MSVALEIYDLVWVYLAANPITATESGFVTYARNKGYLLTDIQKVGAAIYPELVTRMVTKTATFEAVRAAFNGSTVAQKNKVIYDVRFALQNGTFKADDLAEQITTISDLITVLNRQLVNAIVGRSTIVSTFPPSIVKDDSLVLFDYGIIRATGTRDSLSQKLQEILNQQARL